jgi:DNA-binding SARP family transcriptional activator
MEFRILGNLQVMADGHEVHISGLRSQRILAMLLLNANQVVTVGRLGEAAWGADPPETMPQQVRNRISVLRRLLTRPGAVIETHEAGYRIRVGPDQLDLFVFDRLVERARAVASPRLGARMLRDALACWRGPALDGLGELLESQSAILEEKRLNALSRRLDLEIAAGDHAAALPDLRRLNIEYPLHEGFAARLMVALCQQGRQGEALDTYRRLRSQLVAELGVEPGTEVRELNEAAIRGELAAPAAAVATGDPARVPTPRELPRDVADFTGRADELARFSPVLTAASHSGVVGILAVHGTGGIGKSTLAIHAAHKLTHLYPDGQLYVDLQGATEGLRPLPPLEVLGRFLRVLGVDTGEVSLDLSEAAARFRSATAARRLLVVLDNARDAAQVAPLIPGSATCAVLVTSRRMLASLTGAHHLHLDVLSDVEARTYLARIGGAQRIAAEPDAAAEIMHWCGNLPLALRIAGARIAARPGLPLRSVADRLADARRRLDALEFADMGVRSSFDVSLQELRDSGDRANRAAADALVMLSLFDGPGIEVRAVARVLDQPEPRTERALDQLVDVSLLESAAPGRYRLHDLLRLYAREQAMTTVSAEHRAAALNRVLAMYIATAWNASSLVRPGDFRATRRDPRWTQDSLTIADTAQALDWLETERANLLAAIRQAANTPGVPAEAAVQLAQAMYGFFQLRGYWNDMAEASHIALAAARRTGDRPAEAAVHNDLGAALCQLGHYVEAINCLHTGLRIHREVGDRHGEAQGLSNLGRIHRIQGRYNQALACQQRGLTLFAELGDWYGQAVGLVEFGALFGQTGRPLDAVACLNKSLSIYREMGDRNGEAEALRQLGVVQRVIELPEQALATQQNALSIDREFGLRSGLARDLLELGKTLRALGRLDEARAAWRESHTLFSELHSAEADAVAALLDKLTAV